MTCIMKSWYVYHKTLVFYAGVDLNLAMKVEKMEHVLQKMAKALKATEHGGVGVKEESSASEFVVSVLYQNCCWF